MKEEILLPHARKDEPCEWVEGKRVWWWNASSKRIDCNVCRLICGGKCVASAPSISVSFDVKVHRNTRAEAVADGIRWIDGEIQRLEELRKGLEVEG